MRPTIHGAQDVSSRFHTTFGTTGRVEHLVTDRTWRKHDAPHPFPLRLSGRNRIGTNALACRQCHLFLLLRRKRWSYYIRAEERDQPQRILLVESACPTGKVFRP